MNTVAEMREVAKRMEITGISKLRKSELFELITAEIDKAHAEAIEIDKARVVRSAVTDYKLSRVEGFKALAGKVNAYMRFNGTDKLTPAQWRRVRKAMRKHAVTHTDMGQFYVYP